MRTGRPTLKAALAAALTITAGAAGCDASDDGTEAAAPGVDAAQVTDAADTAGAGDTQAADAAGAGDVPAAADAAAGLDADDAPGADVAVPDGAGLDATPMDTGTPTPDAGTDTADDADGSGDASAPCPPGTAPDDEGLCTAAIHWTDGPPLATARDHHMTFVLDTGGAAWLHVTGGTSYKTIFASTESAPIEPDGSLGAWGPGPDLPSPQAGAGVAAAPGGPVVLVSGRDFAGPTPKVWVATASEDGTIAGWIEGPALPQGRFHIAAAWADGTVLAAGGLDGTSHATADVWATELAADGTLGAWQPTTPMPGPRSHQAMFVHDGYLYVVAGLAGDPTADAQTLSDAQRAPLVDGGVGAWEPVGDALPHALAAHAATVVGDHVLLFGGVEDNAKFSDRILRAPLTGGLGPWEELAPLPRKRSHVHQVPLHAGRLYSAGGSAFQVVKPQVDVGALQGPADR